MKKTSKIIATGLMIASGAGLGVFSGEKVLAATRDTPAALKPTIERCAAAIVQLESQPAGQASTDGTYLSSPTISNQDCDRLGHYVNISLPTEPKHKDEIVTDITTRVQEVYDYARTFDDLVGLVAGAAIPAGALWVIAEQKSIRQERIKNAHIAVQEQQLGSQINEIFDSPTHINPYEVRDMQVQRGPETE